ncbi:MAG: hypothetical protein WBA93_11155 [Microcoleaceae cyanobacterium]
MSGFGGRNLLEKASQLYKVLENTSNNEQRPSINSALLVLYQQAKQISQIIAYIWRWSDDNEPLKTPFEVDGNSYNTKRDVAIKLNTYFISPNKKDQCIERTDASASISIMMVGNHLKKLFRACPGKSETIKEWKLLEAVFGSNIKEENPEYLFPIFNSFELGESDYPSLGYLFLIDNNIFQGKIQDPDVNLPFLMKLTLAYPPRPQLGSQLTKNDLTEWIDNRKKDEFVAKNPYIPSSST